MRLIWSLAALLMHIWVSHSFVYPSITTNSIRSLNILFAEDEKYSALVEAYQKKAAAASKIVPEIPPPEVVSSPPEIGTPPEISTPPPIMEQPEVVILPAAKQAVETVIEKSSYVKPVIVDPSVKAPTLFEYIKTVSKGTTPTGSAADFDAMANAKEKLGILRDNILKMGDTEALSGLSTGVTVKETTSGMPAAVGGGGGALSSNESLNAFLASLHLGENAPWYVAGLACVVAIAQRNAGRAEAQSEFAKQLEEAQAKALEAEEKAAAKIASEGASIAKKLTEEAGGKPPETLLESAKLRQLEVELEMARAELTQLTEENARLQQLLDSKTKKGPQGDEKIPAVAPKETMPIDPDEDERILEIIKEVDQANIKGAKKAAKKKKAPVKATTAPPKAAAAPPKAAAKKKKKKTAKKAAKKAAAPADDVLSENPWGSLSESTLKRKTVKDLTEYLSARGVAVKDENGKNLIKAKLVSAVQSL